MSETSGTPRCGDHVHHRPSGEDWLVAWCEGDDLAPAVWPPRVARLADCELQRRCTDAEHAAAVCSWMDAKGGHGPRVRRLYARPTALEPVEAGAFAWPDEFVEAAALALMTPADRVHADVFHGGRPGPGHIADARRVLDAVAPHVAAQIDVAERRGAERLVEAAKNCGFGGTAEMLAAMEAGR